jgi:hypothetical protein
MSAVISIRPDQIIIENDYSRIIIKRIEHTDMNVIMGRDGIALAQAVDFVNRVAAMAEPIPPASPVLHQIPSEETQILDNEAG